MPNSLYLDPKNRISIGRECLQTTLENFKDIRWVGGLGSFWTQKTKPGDIDLALGIKGSIDRKAFVKSLTSHMTQKGLPNLKVDLAVLDLGKPFDWNTEDAMMIYSLIRTMDLIGCKPEWLSALGNNTPFFIG